MRRLMTELGDAAGLPERALRRLSRLKSAEDELMRDRHRPPSRREIVERAGVDRDEADAKLRRAALDAGLGQSPTDRSPAASHSPSPLERLERVRLVDVDHRGARP